jgi:hypothetical protein
MNNLHVCPADIANYLIAGSTICKCLAWMCVEPTTVLVLQIVRWTLLLLAGLARVACKAGWLKLRGETAKQQAHNAGRKLLIALMQGM